MLTATAKAAGKPVTDSITWHYAGQPDVLNIRAGSSAGAKIGAKRYGSDAFVSGGTAMDRHPQPAPENPNPQIPAVGEGDQAQLFENYREGKFSYALPVKPGKYSVTLRFFEPKGQAGERVFDVAANGRKMLDGYDVAAKANGAMKPVEASFAAEAGKDGIKLDFTPIKGQAIISTIEVTPAP